MRTRSPNTSTPNKIEGDCSYEREKVVPRFVLALFIFAASAVFLSSPAVWGTEKEKKDLPQRQISVAPEYTSITVPEGEEVSIDLSVTNGGRQDEFIDLQLTQVPKGWKARIKTYSFDVSGIFVPSDKTKSLSLKAEAEEGTAPGKYVFGIKGQTQDGKLVSTSHVTIVLREKDKGKKIQRRQPRHLLPGASRADGCQVRVLRGSGEQDRQGQHFQPERQGPTNWTSTSNPPMRTS